MKKLRANTFSEQTVQDITGFQARVFLQQLLISICCNALAISFEKKPAEPPHKSVLFLNDNTLHPLVANYIQ